MKKSLLALSALALTAALVHAQPAPPQDGPRQGPPGEHAWQHPEGRTLTKADFLREAEAHFDAMDLNHDGRVTPEEMHAFHEAHRPTRDLHNPRGPGAGPQGGRPPMDGQPPAGPRPDAR